MSQNNASLAGKVAVVSGSSQGIGAATVRELSKRGATVVINYPFPSEKANAESVKESLGAGAQALTVEADISTLQGPQKLVDEAAAAFGKIDILVNNAAFIPHIAFDEPGDNFDQIWDTVINLNLRGTYLLTRAVLKYLAPQNSRIINIVSSAVRSPTPGQGLYVASKGFVEGLTKVLAVELPRKYGCTVNAIAPGPVGTQAFLNADMVLAGALEPLIQMTPVAARVAKPEEIANVVGALCEEGLSWVDGVTINVTGGAAV
ncbi:hypothetical protein ONS96_003941 [Cadophora gregata f. sp. sojae]|nr:hypothetical protein ONS96_003941 [Cadophora gregata f. sp. sojae]